MSKHRIEFSSSPIERILVGILAILFVLSVWSWKPHIMPWQGGLQSLLTIAIVFYFYRLAARLNTKVLTPIIFCHEGQWLEVNQQHQSSWLISPHSRVSGVVLFIKLTSTIDAKETKWVLVFYDQVSMADYRRLCRGIIYQQQTKIS